MKIEQSRSQNVFNRLYKESITLFLSFLVVFVYGLIGNEEVNTNIILFAFITPMLIVVWLVVFNSGDVKVIEHGLEINQQEIVYVHYGQKKVIVWSDYNGFKISKGWLKQIVIFSKNDENIIFDYYTFSKEQRSDIFNGLESDNN